jgi:hypothetical protein
VPLNFDRPRDRPRLGRAGPLPPCEAREKHPRSSIGVGLRFVGGEGKLREWDKYKAIDRYVEEIRRSELPKFTFSDPKIYLDGNDLSKWITNEDLQRLTSAASMGNNITLVSEPKALLLSRRHNMAGMALELLVRLSDGTQVGVSHLITDEERARMTESPETLVSYLAHLIRELARKLSKEVDQNQKVELPKPLIPTGKRFQIPQW